MFAPEFLSTMKLVMKITGGMGLFTLGVALFVPSLGWSYRLANKLIGGFIPDWND